MNQQWFDRMKSRILFMRYHQKGHKQEMPSDYFHCKLQMIQEVFVQTQSKTIMEIMTSTPRYWSILIACQGSILYLTFSIISSITRNSLSATQKLKCKTWRSESKLSKQDRTHAPQNMHRPTKPKPKQTLLRRSFSKRNQSEHMPNSPTINTQRTTKSF